MSIFYLCSDLHCKYEDYNPPNGVDLILCAGDLTNYGTENPNEVSEAKQWLDKMTKKAPVYYIPGNHDIGISAGYKLSKNATNILDDSVDTEWGYITGMSMSGAYSMPSLATRWDHMTCNPEAEKAYYESMPYADIVLSHSPPFGKTGTDPQWGNLGSVGLLQYIKRHKPRLVICGHIHNPIARIEYIGYTKVINVATTDLVIEF